MDTEELAKLCDSLTLTETKEDIFILQGESKERGEKLITCCLVGKVFINESSLSKAF